MKNRTVVIPQEVAAMRAFKKDLEERYHQTKVAALASLLDEMRKTKKEYLARELAQMSGLSTEEVAAQLCPFFFKKAAEEAGIPNKIDVKDAIIARTYIEVLPDGSVNPDNTIVVRRTCKVYKAK